MAQPNKHQEEEVVDLVSDDADGDDFSISTVSDVEDGDLITDDDMMVCKALPGGFQLKLSIPIFDVPILFKAKSLDKLKKQLTRKLGAVAKSFPSRIGKNRGQYLCQACYQTFVKAELYVEHISVCPIICSICGNLFPSEEDCQQHIALHNMGLVDLTN